MYLCVCIKQCGIGIVFLVGSFGLIQDRVKTLRNAQCPKAFRKAGKKFGQEVRGNISEG